ncbi:hypothetical protein [Paraliobacillus salinarum]|uniref:hypothetical protein n=1 Tax=Paraliobacillus salinarum TaxID=1158996 RepID=UPI0015F615E8|nr:hypothetical protein [Paraliobacillus salinarum]
MKKINKIIFSIILFFVLIIFLILNQGYDGKYIRWEEITNQVKLEALERNNIPYEIKDNIIYIPEDAFDKAIYCCS